MSFIAPESTVSTNPERFYLILRGHNTDPRHYLTSLGVSQRCFDALYKTILASNKLPIDSPEELRRNYSHNKVTLIIPGGNAIGISEALSSEIPAIRKWVAKGTNVFGSCAGASLISEFVCYTDYKERDIVMYYDNSKCPQKPGRLKTSKTLGLLPMYSIGPTFEEGPSYKGSREYKGRTVSVHYPTSADTKTISYWNSGATLFPSCLFSSEWVKSKLGIFHKIDYTREFPKPTVLYLHDTGYNERYYSGVIESLVLPSATMLGSYEEAKVAATTIHPELVVTSTDPSTTAEIKRDNLQMLQQCIDHVS